MLFHGKKDRLAVFLSLRACYTGRTENQKLCGPLWTLGVSWVI